MNGTGPTIVTAREGPPSAVDADKGVDGGPLPAMTGVEVRAVTAWKRSATTMLRYRSVTLWHGRSVHAALVNRVG
jgi:hypothetical protein